MEAPSSRSAFFFLLLLLAPALVDPTFLPFINPFWMFDPVPPNQPAPPETPANPDHETNYAGAWKLISENAGVSAMHLIILPNNKAIMYDSTIFQPAQVKLPKGTDCRVNPKRPDGKLDCWSHAVEFDLETAEIRPLKVLTDTWCSSGALDTEGNLVQTGGFNFGGRGVRFLTACDTCDWREYTKALAVDRWYSTQQMLPDGSFIVIGGRRQFNYEFVPAEGESNANTIDLHFLNETTDKVENNLYPFVHLAPDGNLFIFANDRSIIFDPRANKVVRELPRLEGGSRNYPSSGTSALLPLVLDRKNAAKSVEVIVCGGTPSNAFSRAEKGQFLPALQTCGRISITEPGAKWQIEQMPIRRTMGDVLILPNGELLLINGASKGCSGWWFAREPVFSPVLYRPTLPADKRFRTLAPTNIPRVYHSTSAVLPDATILVAGSNTNNGYNFTRVLFPTELRVEKFLPPYLDPALEKYRPSINEDSVNSDDMSYGERFAFKLAVQEYGAPLEMADVKVTMYAPPFTTHGYSMGQRLLVLNVENLEPQWEPNTYQVTVTAPPSGAIAPPGYYLIFVVNRGVPSKGAWVKIR